MLQKLLQAKIKELKQLHLPHQQRKLPKRMIKKVARARLLMMKLWKQKNLSWKRRNRKEQDFRLWKINSTNIKSLLLSEAE
jgi:hypothetical protein